MITTSMTCEEIIKIYTKDLNEIEEFVKRTLTKEYNSMVKLYNRTKKPVDFKTRTLTLSGIKYKIIIIGVTPKKPFIFSVYTIINDSKTGKKTAIYFPSISPDKINIKDTVTVYTPHFFKRYNERFLKNDKLSLEELIDTYFRRNGSKMASIKKVTKEDGTIDLLVSAKSLDGVGLGKIDLKHSKSIILKTFISNDLLFDDQDKLRDEGEIGKLIKEYTDINNSDFQEEDLISDYMSILSKIHDINLRGIKKEEE